MALPIQTSVITDKQDSLQALAELRGETNLVMLIFFYKNWLVSV